ncbi:MAG: ATP-binding cassette domain-containing protein [Candidatus Cloacimonadales bacterium]|jgi:phospholipid/cholesterol/gamma-HCH transport system ATP-binding protein|nr:ATP-binding cassette domain-containing protein [Candidatus Cloacimonadota bacterium]MDD2649967.1 ATP-binding cassette domain-containing protein [Candidatus Cloacimonadota bacterium]MDX9976513.1 ATP-binding cassette domain-containing protein [Candidatus Cloacimonadales bacterium]
MIEIKQMSVDLGGKSILENVSVNIKDNCNTMILGKSGSGKSVLMKSAIGFFPLKHGNVYIDGHCINKLKRKALSEIRVNIGYLFQNAALFDSMNVYQNVAFPLIEHKKYSTEQEVVNRVQKALSAVQLDDVMYKMPADLSGGMRKRVGLARSIIMDPKYIIYDEPTSGLDPVTASEIIGLIGTLQKQFQMTSIVITHDIAVVERLGENIVMLSDRQLAFSGNYDEFKKSEVAVVKEFLSFF